MAVCENEDKTNRISDVEAIKKVLACLDNDIIKDLQERFKKSITLNLLILIVSLIKL